MLCCTFVLQMPTARPFCSGCDVHTFTCVSNSGKCYKALLRTLYLCLNLSTGVILLGLLHVFLQFHSYTWDHFPSASPPEFLFAQGPGRRVSVFHLLLRTVFSVTVPPLSALRGAIPLSSGFSGCHSQVRPLCVSRDLCLRPARCDWYVVGAWGSVVFTFTAFFCFVFCCFIEGFTELASNCKQCPLCVKPLLLTELLGIRPVQAKLTNQPGI